MSYIFNSCLFQGKMTLWKFCFLFNENKFFTIEINAVLLMNEVDGNEGNEMKH